MKIISVYNNKGGCAKTVTAVNLAYNLSAIGYRVLVIDMDPQGNASSFFRRYDLNKPSVKDYLSGKKTFHQCIKKTMHNRLEIVPSNIFLRELKPSDLLRGNQSLKEINREIDALCYQYCIIDCPPSADFLIELVMQAANNVIIPVKPERFSADGLGTVQEIIRDFGNGQLTAACLFTQYYKAKDTRKAIEYILTTQQVKAYDNVIRRTSSVDHSVLVRRPLLKCASRSTAALDYMDFTKEYLEKEKGKIRMALLDNILGGDRPKEKGAAFPVVMVHYTKLIPSEANNYSVEGIKELANMIRLSGGVKQNLLVRKKTADEYELIAGHRRRLAVKYLVEELGEESYAMLPVHVEKDGDTLSEINLILTNCGARERSDWEKMMEIERLTELIQVMQSGSVSEQERFKQTFGIEPGITGRELRKMISRALGLSETKVANLNHISKNLSPSLKERFREGEIGISVANEAAALPAVEQQELSQKKEIRIADVKQRKSVSESDTEDFREPKKTVSDSDTGAKETELEKVEGQMDITDFPEYLPESRIESVSESDTAHFTEQQEMVSDSDTWFDRCLLERMIAKAEEIVRGFEKEIERPPIYYKAVMQVHAYKLLMEKYDKGNKNG